MRKMTWCFIDFEKLEKVENQCLILIHQCWNIQIQWKLWKTEHYITIKKLAIKLECLRNEEKALWCKRTWECLIHKSIMNQIMNSYFCVLLHHKAIPSFTKEFPISCWTRHHAKRKPLSSTGCIMEQVKYQVIIANAWHNQANAYSSSMTTPQKAAPQDMLREKDKQIFITIKKTFLLLKKTFIMYRG